MQYFLSPMAFMIVAGTILVVNAIFLIGSLIYTVKVTKSKADHRLSTLGSVLDARLSLQPQVVLYEAIVRMSGNPSLNEKYMGEKSDNQTTQAA